MIDTAQHPAFEHSKDSNYFPLTCSKDPRFFPSQSPGLLTFAQITTPLLQEAGIKEELAFVRFLVSQKILPSQDYCSCPPQPLYRVQCLASGLDDLRERGLMPHLRAIYSSPQGRDLPEGVVLQIGKCLAGSFSGSAEHRKKIEEEARRIGLL